MDRGTMSAPAIEVLESQMLSFKSSWDKVKYDDKPILPPAAVREIQSLLVHVRRGCLAFDLVAAQPKMKDFESSIH